MFDHKTYKDTGTILNFFEMEVPRELSDCLYSRYSIIEIIARHGISNTKEFVKLGKVYEAQE